MNVIRRLAPNKEYVIFMENYLKQGVLLGNEFDKLVHVEAPYFVLNFEGRVCQKIKDGVVTPYLKWEFCRDFIQRMHNEYGHFLLARMCDLVERRGW